MDGATEDGQTMARRARSGGCGRVPRLAAGILLVLAIALGTAAGDRAVAQEDAPAATVRVVHGAADAGAIDLYVDGALALAGIAFPSVSDPLSLPAGEHELRIVGSGVAPDAALVVADVELEAGRLYEAAALGTVDDLQANLYEVDLSPLADGRVRLRLIHGSPDAGPLTLAIGGAAEEILPAVEFPNESAAIELDAGAYDLEFRTEDGAAALSLGGTQLEAGVVYDLFVIGQVGDDSLRVLAVVAQPTEAPAADARPTALYAGACAEETADLGQVVSPLNGPAAPVGDAQGQDGAAPAASSVTAIDLPFDDLLADAHAIAVLAADAEDAPVVACGEIGGTLTANGALVVGLREANGSGVAGVAILAPSALDPATSDVSVFVADDLVGGDQAASLPPEAEAEPTATPAASPATTEPTAPAATPDAAAEVVVGTGAPGASTPDASNP